MTEPVTRHFSAKNGTNATFHPPSVEPMPGIFCDWISIYQSHGAGLPLVNDGAYVKYDADGEHEFTALKKLRVEGSHESSVSVRCDGCTVWFEGNISKFGRADNVFGYSFAECIKRINALVMRLGLPPFTDGVVGDTLTAPGQWQKAYTGARINRLDVTQNFAAGSRENAGAFMRYLSMQQASRLKTGTYGEGETIDFGRGSKRIYSKAYLKGPELRKHAKKARKIDSSIKELNPYIEALADWCDFVGLVRFETTYKGTWLIDKNQQYLGGIDMNVIHADFEKRKEIFTRCKLDIDELTDLEPKLLSVYRMWQAGDDLAMKFTRRTFYRHRARLLPYGVDIAIRSNVVNFEPRTRVITLGPVTPPSFYERPHFNHLALVA